MKRNRVPLRKYCDLIRPDLVEHEAVLGDSVRAHYDLVDLSGLHHETHRGVGDYLTAEPVPLELEGGEPRPLKCGPRLRDHYLDALALFARGPYNPEGGPVADGREGSSVTMGEYCVPVLDQVRAELSEPLVGCDVLLGHLDYLLHDRLFGLLYVLRTRDHLHHPVCAPEEVHRRGPRRAETRGCRPKLEQKPVSPRGLRVDRRDRYPHGRRHADRGGPTDDEPPYRVRDVLPPVVGPIYEAPRKERLVDHLDPALPCPSFLPHDGAQREEVLLQEKAATGRRVLKSLSDP